MNNLPKISYQNKIISKDKFRKNKQEFTDKVKRVKLLNVLNEQTTNITQEKGTDAIVIIELSLKQKQIPQDVIRQIESDIKANIIFQIEYDGMIKYGFYDKKLYTTNWNEQLKLISNVSTIDQLYKSMCAQIIGKTIEDKSYEQIIEEENFKQSITKEINKLEQQKLNEKQMDRKLVIRNKINELKKELAKIGE